MKKINKFFLLISLLFIFLKLFFPGAAQDVEVKSDGPIKPKIFSVESFNEIKLGKQVDINDYFDFKLKDEKDFFLMASCLKSLCPGIKTMIVTVVFKNGGTYIKYFLPGQGEYVRHLRDETKKIELSFELLNGEILKKTLVFESLLEEY